MHKQTLGKLLEEQFLIPHALSQSALAQAINVSKTRISDIINGKRAMTADTDLRLCAFFGLEAGYFLNRQLAIDLQKAKETLKTELAKIKPRQKKQTQIENSSPCSHIHVALICGGPSLERGISLNSARSVVDHLSRQEIEIHPIYVDLFKNFYSLSQAQLYSNSPSDFDCKLKTTAHKLSENEVIQTLKQMDLVFPVIHGTFGEDGNLQAFLEKHSIPFIGSSSATCHTMFDKYTASSLLKRHGFATLPMEVLRKDSPHLEKTIFAFFRAHSLTRAVIKPVAGGSSIGVFSAYTPEEAVEKTNKLFQTLPGEEAILEPFCSGKEFTIIILQNPDGAPVSLIPTEIQVSYENGGLFDYRRKYLPTTNTHWFCPPRFSDTVIDDIRMQAEELFKLFHMRDFARIDGWLLHDGRLIFTDFNPISGMEQNSFIFQQASRIGLSHEDLLWNIVQTACQREKIDLPNNTKEIKKEKEPVHVLFGGKTAERQVSLMSGTNVWLKLKKSSKYEPKPYLLDHNTCVWSLPYTYALNHTVEEIYENCLTAEATTNKMKPFIQDIQKRLLYAPKDYKIEQHIPKRFSLDDFLDFSKQKQAFLFLGLHGGDGENGVLQTALEKKGLLYNGSKPKASELCMDKYLTGQVIASMGHHSILTVPKKQIKLSSLFTCTHQELTIFWQRLKQELSSDTFIIKPQRDGCSAGIIRLFSPDDLHSYITLIQKKVSSIPINTFTNQPYPIEMPLLHEDDYLIESFIETDYLRIVQNEVVYKQKNGWIELTAGVTEENGIYHALNPSVTIAEGEVLSVEEKFQGGTGVNITPPLETLLSETTREELKRSIETIAKTLSIQNYARIDLFFNILSKKIYVIEANTLPALTPSTVLYHQALAETPSLYPTQFLEKLISETK